MSTKKWHLAIPARGYDGREYMARACDGGAWSTQMHQTVRTDDVTCERCKKSRHYLHRLIEGEAQ